jgi:hypothetical protein
MQATRHVFYPLTWLLFLGGYTPSAYTLRPVDTSAATAALDPQEPTTVDQAR